MKMLHPPEQLREIRQFEVFDDFLWYISPHIWTSLAADTNATVTVSDAKGGIVTMNTGDNTDNNEVGLFTTKELFLFGSDAPILGQGLIKYSEVNTSAANVAFGFADAAAANLITDNGAAVTANSAALIYKVDGGTVWRCYSENNGTINDTASTTTAGGSSYQKLRIQITSIDATNVEITYFCDNEPLRDSNGKAIKHTLAYASATEMKFGLYGKVGAANTLSVLADYLYATQLR